MNIPLIQNPLKEMLAPLGILQSGQMIGFPANDRIGLIYILGRIGQGKSEMLTTFAINDILQGRGGIFIDPFGDINAEIMKHIPADKRSSVKKFEVKKGDAKSNIAKFKKEIHLNEFAKKPGLFLLCSLHYPLIGAFEARETGLYILKEYLKALKSKGLINHSVFIDEAHNFLNKEILADLLKSRKQGFSVIFSDQNIDAYSSDMMDLIFNATDNLICYNIEKRTARFAAHKIGIAIQPEYLESVEKYHFWASLKINGKREPAIKACGVFPIPYPKTK